MEKVEIVKNGYVKIIKNGHEIIVNGIKCKVIRQESKGPNKEVVDIEKAVGTDWQKYISLSKLAEGSQDVQLKPRKVVDSKNYTLTEEEKTQVEELQAQIDAIIENAKARYVKFSFKSTIDTSKLNNAQKLEAIRQLEAQLEKLKAN